MRLPKAKAYIPVALVTDNPEGGALRKKVWENTPVANNYQIVKKDELEVRVQGNTLFARWSVPILLLPSKYMLPPASVLFEGYGKIVSGVSNTIVPSGRKVTTEYNGLEAFVTFSIHHPNILDQEQTAYSPETLSRLQLMSFKLNFLFLFSVVLNVK